MAWSDAARQASIAARQASAQTKDTGIHQVGVQNVGRNLVADKVLDVIRNSPHGASITLNGETPKGGYMVSQSGRTQYVDTKDLTGPAAKGILNAYAARNKGELTKPGAHIGVWNDPATGKTHLDVSNNIARQREAVAAGRQHNQISIYDVKRNRTIDTGGKGD